VIHGLVEPLLCLAAAFLLSPVDRVLSIWLRFAALALMLKAMIHRREGHQQMLDALDDRMSARNRHAALQQQTNPRHAKRAGDAGPGASATRPLSQPRPGVTAVDAAERTRGGASAGSDSCPTSQCKT
jgi:hypothetical protein